MGSFLLDVFVLLYIWKELIKVVISMERTDFILGVCLCLLASKRSERASISSVRCKSAIYILYVCMYSVFYGTFTSASMNNLDSAMNSTFHAGWSSPD